jgi:hypothetical protein
MIEAELPDGTVLEFPDGTSPAVVQAAVRKTMGVKAPSQPDAFDQKLRESAKINPALKAGAEVLGGATGLMRGTANIVGGVFGNSKLGQQIWPTASLDKSSLSYTVGELIDPVSMGIGGAAFKGAGAIPQIAKLTKIKPIVQGMVGGGVAGGATGALSENGDAGTGAAVGALFGGAIPGVVMGAQKLRKIAEPITKAGAQTHAGRMVKEVAGDTYDDVLSALKNLNTPFSKPSVAQATAKLNNPEIAALQRVAEGISPVPGVTREAAQRGERAGLLQSFAGTDDEIKRLIEARAANSYSSVLKQPVKGDSELGNILRDPYVKDTFAEVRKLVDASRVQGRDVPLGEQLQMVKKSLDKTLSGTPVNKPSSNETRAITDVQSRLNTWMKSNIKGYADVGKEYAELSGDLFQKKVGQNMLGLLQKPLGEGESGAKLARAVEAETSLVKKSGGFGREGLDEQLTPENLAKVGKVISQLDADTTISELSRKGMRSAAIRDAVGTGIELPNLMNQGVAIANGLIRRVFGAGQIKTLRELAEVMQDPALTAKLMERATAKEKNAIEFMRKTMQYYSPYVAAQAGSME